jgi:two-component system, chemotaxis family, CheB/CheR fusion protein
MLARRAPRLLSESLSNMRSVSSAVSEHSAQLAAIVESSTDAIMGATLDGVITSWNHGAERLYGYSAQEAVGQPLALIVPPKQHAHLADLLNRCARGERSRRIETLGQVKDGRHIWIAVTMFPVQRAGRISGVGCIARDITASKDAEAALRASERRFRRMIDSNIIGISLGDLDGRILDANDALLRMVGYTREDLQAGTLRWDRITPPEYLALDNRAIAEARRVGAATPWEKEYIRRDGRRVPVLIGFALLDTVPGTTVAFVLDLSERKRAEAERERLLAENRRQQALLEAAFAASPAGLAVIGGPEPTIRFVNPAYVALAPHGGSDLVGGRLAEVWPGAEQAGVLDLVRRALRTGEPSTLDRYERRYADGSIRSFAVKVVGLGWQDEPAVLVALWETTVLEQARAAAEQAVRARDEFISVASHELKTPISALLAMAQLARRRLERARELDQAKATEFVDLVYRQADRLSRLGAQLLDTSRIKAGQLAVQPEPTDLVELVRGVVGATVQPRTIIVDAPSRLVAEVDPLRLEQVVRNLIDNAIKYSPEGDPIDVTVGQPTGDSAVIAVRDHGIGVPPEHRAHIFEPFYRAHAEGRTSGLGLGLHISRQIVQQHGGQIEAEFPCDGGTRFVVSLPLTSVSGSSG